MDLTMSKWEEFEILATNHLNENFNEFATFTRLGGADSTIPDIQANTKTGKEFYIEAKCGNAQCGQFVLQPDIATSTFIYTAKNPINKYAKEIIEFMNKDFEAFKEAGPAGKIIDMPAKTFINWITKINADKNVKYFITDDFVLVPLEKLEEFFDVTARYRVKRSGSGSVPKAKVDNVIDKIKTLPISSGITEYRKINGKLFVKAENNIHNQRFVYEGNEYMFSQRDDEYEVRKLSNTFNANVIFTISLKNKDDKYKAEFVKLLK